MSDGPERHVWERAFSAWDDAPTNPSRIGDADQAAAAVIRSYGDERDAEAHATGHAAGYQAAITDVVEWLRSGDAFARTDHEAAQEITRRFGKGQ